jgi:membrane protease YdiL (CAAX protease family)
VTSLYRLTAATENGEARSRRGILAFLAIAFGLAWVPFLGIPLGLDEGAAPLFMPVAPAVACVVVRKWVTREGFTDAGLRPNLRRWPFYLLAVAWPLATSFLSVHLALALGVDPVGFSWPWGLDSPRPISLLTWLVLAIVLAPVFFGEEFGWRGYLQLRLLADHPLRAAVATGLIWGVWHYPLILVGGQPTEDRFQTILLFPVATTVLSVFLGWLRFRTSSVWATSVGHASNNITELNLTQLAFTGSTGGTLPASASAPIILAEAIVLLGIVATDHLVILRRAAPIPAARP